MIFTDNSQMALGERLKEARKLRKMSQVALANAARVSQGLISDLENNLYPTSSYVPKFADILKVSAIWLADGKGEKFLPVENALHQIKQSDNYVKPSVSVAGMKIKSNEAVLLEHYRKLSPLSQQTIDLLMNTIYGLEYPNDGVANPTNGKSKKKERETQ